MAGPDDDFVREHEPLVRKIATRLRADMELGLPLEDLVAWGFHGLIEARARFEADRGVQFSTFAYYRIRGSMIDGVRKMAYLPRRLHHMRRVAEAADFVAEATAEARAGASEAQLADTEATLGAIDDVLGKITAAFVIDALGQSEEAPRPDAESTLIAGEDQQRVRAALATLPEREAIVIQRFYFEEKVLDDVAAELGVSRSWASRIHTRALGLLRDALEKTS
jgi:RNA polymerase sigma factor for flagellar operon FliA